MTRYRITAPVADFSGEVAGVAFAAGRAETDDTKAAALGYFRRRGYTVRPIADDVQERDDTPADGETPMPRKSASKADWKAYAISRGMDADEAEDLSRDQLVERFHVDEGDDK